MSKNLTTDIEGIIRELNISEEDVLYPFYEAVVNSIQAIDERKNCSEGEISVYIEREKANNLYLNNTVNIPYRQYVS